MPDWEPHVRTRLSSLRLSPAREHEIVEELSQHLDDRWRELVAGGMPEDEATRAALAGFRDPNMLARYLAPLEQARQPAPITPALNPGPQTLCSGCHDTHEFFDGCFAAANVLAG
jgi:putative ABC transport system permease protein